MLAIGFAPFDGFAVRVDILERIAAQIRTRAREAATFEVPPALAAEAGLTRSELGELMMALGFQAVAAEAGQSAYTRPTKPRRERTGGRRPPNTGPSHSPFAVLASLRVAPRA
jgi:hypothetical protein